MQQPIVAAALDSGAAATTAAPTPPPKTIAGLREIASEFDGVLLDQFGVLHDGRTPYPRAIEAVRQLHSAGKTVVIVSNSSRRSSGTIGKLAAMGFGADWFAGAVTSGELARTFLERRPDAWWRDLGTRALHITWSTRGRIDVGGLGLELVGPEKSSEGGADFILAHGTEAVSTGGGGGGSVSSGDSSSNNKAGLREATLDELRALLKRCAAAAKARGRAMPMVVANPDIVTVDGAGGLITMPGTMAEWYAEAGGEVVLMGKPAGVIYDAAAALAPQIARGRWLAIGDSLAHDIAGAAAAATGPSLFVASGIHADELRLSGSQDGGNAASEWDADALTALCASHGATPTYAMAWLEW
jgi:HAD superfamily hydrolase (TIGR01450 family)